MNPDDKPYDYADAGLDSFLSRSIDNLSQMNLDSPGPQSNQVRFDSAQVSGMLGGKIQLGKVVLDKDRITFSDGEVLRGIIGTDVGGF